MSMGVYIKGMEMPQNCFKCPAHEWYDFGAKSHGYQCPILRTTKAISNVEAHMRRRDNCPLVPVPPHGKLVEVADVKELFEKHFGDDQIAFQLIDSVPVIIPPKSKEQQDQEDLVERLNREGIAP